MDIDQTLQILKKLADNPDEIAKISEPARIELLRLTGAISRPNKFERQARSKSFRKLKRKLKFNEDQQSRSQTGIRKAREKEIFSAPEQEALPTDSSFNIHSARNCYVCKKEYSRLHFFYDSMCTECGDFNYQKRFQTASLSGKVAVITGARLKIGYHASLMMLRAGARVIVTTRFPNDAARRYAQEKDASDWLDRLQIYGLDLRHSPSVHLFCRMLDHKLDRLDILINNAAQTVRRPPGFYAHLLDFEMQPFTSLTPAEKRFLTPFHDLKSSLESKQSAPDTALVVPWQTQHVGLGITESVRLSQIPYSFENSLVEKEIFPEGKLDADLQQVDLRTVNSWRLKLGEVAPAEMIEVQLVNSVAPFILCNELLPLMQRDFTGSKHIVNVTAMEGKFYRFKKEDRHPHTNMAKAALNMLTHTAAAGLEKSGIFINAVDTGWVTDEDPAQLAREKQERHDFQPPLDIVDGAARICDPFFDGILTGEHWSGKFLKDYRPIDW